MLPDEIEFIIAKAKLDVELKFNEDQPRDENGRWAETDGAEGITLEKIDKEVQKASGPHKAVKALIKIKNFDTKPEVVSSESELSGIKMYRGVLSDNSTTAPEMVEQFKNKEMFVGEGIFGSGVYFAPEKTVASRYAYGMDGALFAQGAIITGALKEDANVLVIPNDSPKEYVSLMEDLSDKIPRDIFAKYVVGKSDPSLLAILNGYDAIHVPRSETLNTPEQYIVLNRGAMQVVA